jgi:hypothetical protein
MEKGPEKQNKMFDLYFLGKRGGSLEGSPQNTPPTPNQGCDGHPRGILQSFTEHQTKGSAPGPGLG